MARADGASRRVVVNFVHEATEAVRGLLLDFDLELTLEKQPELYNTALVLLSAPICGPDTTRLASFTGLPCSFITPIRRRMIQAELWSDSEVLCDEWFVADGVLCRKCFWLDVLVANGLVKRIWDEEGGRYWYGHNSENRGRVN
jgi:hypothetical protein